MGSLSNTGPNMRAAVFVCLFAAAYAAPAADADADPALLYSGLHHLPLTYGLHGAAVVPAVQTAAVKSVVSKPAEVEVKSVATPVVYNTAVHHTPLVYNTPVVHHTPVVHTAPVVHTPVVAKAASYYANSGGAVHIVKRDADADADADAYYGVYGYAPYRSAYYGHPYSYAAYTPYRYFW